MRILFLCLYPENKAPSQRFRFEQFFPYFREAGIEFDVDSFYSSQAHNLLYKKGNRLKKSLLVIYSYFTRLFRLPGFRKYDYIFIQRAASPVGPALFEWILARVFKKKIIYDFDDAIWMPQDGKGGAFFRWLKSYDKVGKICKMAYHVTPGNEFLAAYAKQFTSRVTVIPTVVDTEKKYNQVKKYNTSFPFIIGWTGSHSTIRYLLTIKKILKEIANDDQVSFLFIADKATPELDFKKMKFLKWNEETEIVDLLPMDIGLMPLADNDWTKGKCGFKAIQYMALGIPAIVSRVGVNDTIVQDGINGFVCDTDEEWKENIMILKNNPELRREMGLSARVRIEQHYSVKYALPLILSLMEQNQTWTFRSDSK